MEMFMRENLKTMNRMEKVFIFGRMVLDMKGISKEEKLINSDSELEMFIMDKGILRYNKQETLVHRLTI